jgi:hypothetical protein
LNNEPTVCPQCLGVLIETDHYGERLIGCVECNRWTRRGSKLIVQLPDEDIDALRRRQAAGEQL